MRNLWFPLVLTAFLLSACSTLSPFYSVSGNYKSYVNSNLIKKRLYDRGRLLVTADILAVTPELISEQEKYVPGFSFKKDETKTQFIVAVSLSSAEVFSKSSIRFFLNGQPAVYVKEEAQKPLLETLYYYSQPFNRVMFVDFEKAESSGKNELTIQTPQGTVVAEINP